MWSRFFLIFFFISMFGIDLLWSYEFLPGHVYDLDSVKRFSPFGWEKKNKVHNRKSGLSGSLSTSLIFIFRFYQDFLSPVDGPKCSYYPTCSQFGIEAVRQYGPFWGLLMLFNRQMREYPGLTNDKWFPFVIRYGILRIYDPPERAFIWSSFWR